MHGAGSGTNFDGMVAPWPRKVESWGYSTSQGANSFMISWRASNPKSFYLVTGGPVPGEDVYSAHEL